MHTRQAKVVFLICFISLATLWACRFPKLCISAGASDDNLHHHGPVQHDLDLSRADAPFIAWPLARICRETDWVPNLIFVCDNNSGGIGNIRNYILTCLRYAISAGASGLLMPSIQTRSEENLSQLFKGRKPLSYFFDEAHFRQSLSRACPQLSIYDDKKDVPGHLDPIRVESITPNHYGIRGGCDRRDLNRHVDLFGPRFRMWFEESASRPVHQYGANSSEPRFIRLNWGVQWNYPVYRDGPEFVATFGSLLKFRKDILQLGELIVTAVRGPGGLSHAATDPSTGYLGIHLRTENDALKRWPNFTTQTSAYLEKASQSRFRVAYLATGNLTEAARFTALALSNEQIRVFTKRDLVQNSSNDLETLDNLTWDQQSIVDFIVLLQSDYFLGVSPSSFSMNVALKRNLKYDGLYTRPWKIGDHGNDRSWLVGNYDQYWNDWLFMFDSLWP